MTDTAAKLLRYLFTGGAAAVVDIGGFELLASMRVPVVLAAASSFLIAAIVNFWLTSRWVFRATPTNQLLALFLVVAGLGMLMNVSVTSIGVLYLNLPRGVSKTIAVGTTFLLNFWMNARFVFRDRPCAPA